MKGSLNKMKFRKSISIVLTGIMVANLTCSYIAKASASAETNEAMSETTTAEKELDTNNKLEVADDTTQKQLTDNKGQENLIVSSSKVESGEPTASLSRKELIDKFLLKNSKYIPKSKVRDLASKLKRLNDEDIYKLNSISLNNPKHVRLISIFFGSMGIDRMIIGKVGTGILKFLTGGGLGIWWLADVFKIEKLTKEQNWKKLKKEIQII